MAERDPEKMIEPGRCGGCRWWVPDTRTDYPAGKWGSCHVAPPANWGAMRSTGLESVYPMTSPGNGCAQYSAAVMQGSGHWYAPLAVR